MTITATQAAPNISFEDYMALANEDSNTEWVRGEVIEVGPVSDRHQLVTKFLLTLLDEFVEQHKLGEVRFSRFTMLLSAIPSVRHPDILFVSTVNRHRLNDMFVDGPADAVIEVVTLESRLRDRGTKFYEYEQGGVPEYWLIDPIREQAEFYRLNEGGRYKVVPVSPDGYFHSQAITGFRLNPTWLWDDPLPQPLSVLELASQSQAS